MRTLIMGVAVLAAACASAQSRDAFQTAGLSDVSVSGSGPSYTLTIGANPMLICDGVSYTINSVFGFYLLSDDEDILASADQSNGWTFWMNNADGGGVVGYFTQPPNGLTPNSSLTFSFTGLDTSLVDGFGYHLRTDLPNPCFGGGNTGFVTVPEPASWVALASLLLPLALRRRR